MRFVRWLDLPVGKSVGVAFTFDVDGEAALLGTGQDEEKYTSAFSERQFGMTTGLARILGLLEEYRIRGTFYVPGYTAGKYPGAIREIVDRGHEVACHGYKHLPPQLIDAVTQRDEIERGKDVLEAVSGREVFGYRSPAWELPRSMFALLLRAGFSYDSSLMGFDEPYVYRDGGLSIAEMPVHWSLDDWPYYSWRDGVGGPLSRPSAPLEVWRTELVEAKAEGGFVTYTFHPAVSGRRYRFAQLRELVRSVSEDQAAWTTTHGDAQRRLDLGREALAGDSTIGRHDDEGDRS